MYNWNNFVCVHYLIFMDLLKSNLPRYLNNNAPAVLCIRNCAARQSEHKQLERQRKNDEEKKNTHNNTYTPKSNATKWFTWFFFSLSCQFRVVFMFLSIVLLNSIHFIRFENIKDSQPASQPALFVYSYCVCWVCAPPPSVRLLWNSSDMLFVTLKIIWIIKHERFSKVSLFCERKQH